MNTFCQNTAIIEEYEEIFIIIITDFEADFAFSDVLIQFNLACRKLFRSSPGTLAFYLVPDSEIFQ